MRKRTLICENISANNKGKKKSDSYLLSSLKFLTLNKHQFSAGQKLPPAQCSVL